MSRPGSAAALGLMECPVCGLVCSVRPVRMVLHCPRCSCRLSMRAPRSAERTFAWLLAGMILYVPANCFPVMYTSGIGGGQESTIFDGILTFWRSGSWDLALIIFIASVAVPATKFIALGLVLWTVRKGSSWRLRERTKLFRFVEVIGYWSMLDVVVVALTSALLKFKVLGSAEPRIGILFFCAVVVTTMLAALSFDPRLIWDGAHRRG